MKRFQWMLLESIGRCDRAALAGLALLAAAVGFQLAVNEPARARLAQLRLETAAQRSAAQAGGPRALQRAVPDSARADAFYAYFPSRKSAPESLDLIYQAAARQALALNEGQYALVPGKAAKLLEYQVSLPVKGSYAQIRRFAVQVLHDVPAASLDELVFRRDAVGSAEVEAKIRFTLHMRSE